MSRRRGEGFWGWEQIDERWIRRVWLRPVEAARRERVARKIRRVKRRAEKRWPT